MNSWQPSLSPLPVNTPEITINITVLDEQAMRQEEAREMYLKWLSENEVRNADQKADLKLTPSRHNVTPGW